MGRERLLFVSLNRRRLPDKHLRFCAGCVTIKAIDVCGLRHAMDVTEVAQALRQWAAGLKPSPELRSVADTRQVLASEDEQG